MAAPVPQEPSSPQGLGGANWEHDIFGVDQGWTIRASSLFFKERLSRNLSVSVPQTVSLNKPGVEAQTFHRAEQLGSGSFGVVYKYEHKTGDTLSQVRTLAVKATVLDELVVQNKLFEPQKCGAVPVRRVHAELQGCFLFAMPVMDTGVCKLFESEGELEKKIRVVEAVRKQTLCILQETGVPYLDLKPNNILFDREGSARVADLGSLQLIEKKILPCPYPPPETARLWSHNGSNLLAWSVGMLLLQAVRTPRKMGKFSSTFSLLSRAEKQTEIEKAQRDIRAVCSDRAAELINFDAKLRPDIATLTIFQKKRHRTLLEQKFDNSQGGDHLKTNKKRPKNQQEQ